MVLIFNYFSRVLSSSQLDSIVWILQSSRYSLHSCIPILPPPYQPDHYYIFYPLAPPSSVPTLPPYPSPTSYYIPQPPVYYQNDRTQTYGTPKGTTLDTSLAISSQAELMNFFAFFYPAIDVGTFQYVPKSFRAQFWVTQE